jgi:AcrR family transcriptional regulator
MGRALRSMSNEPQPYASAVDDPTHTRNRILGAAAQLFSRQGFRGTTIRQISEIVGILSGSLFHYFRSKHEMLAEVMHDAALSMCEQADAVIASRADAREQLRGLIRLQLECLAGEQRKDFYAVLISEWRELDEASKPRLTELRKRYFASWHSVLEDCARCGMLRAEPQATQLALHGAINWTNTWYESSGRLSLEDYTALLEDFVLERPRV